MNEQLPSPKTLPNRRVLVIDDDRDFADSLCNLLRMEGYDVEPAYSLAGARMALDRFPADVALIDIRMGEESGLTLVSEFRQRQPEMICVIMTAYALVESAIQALQDGAYDFLCKPFYPEHLIATLERCFERIALALARDEAARKLRIRNQELETLNARLKHIVVSMQTLSASTTCQAICEVAVAAVADTMHAHNAALYLIEGPELVLHCALSPGMLQRMPLPKDANFGASDILAVLAPVDAPAQAGDLCVAQVDRGLANKSLLTFPLEGEARRPFGLFVLEIDHESELSEQDREFGLILISFIGEALRRAQALDGMRWNEARLREIVDNSPSLIFLNDLEGRSLIINQRLKQWHGISPASALGKTADEAFPEQIARLYRSQCTVVVGDDGVAEEEIEVPFQDGTPHTVLVTKFPVRNDDGRHVGIGTIATDVTDRRRAEEHLRQAQKMEALGQLTGGIAHDFNNLLAVIIGNLDLLEEVFDDRSVVRELVDDSLNSARCGTELIHRLLAFARRQRLYPQPVDVNEIVKGMSRMLSRTLGEAIKIKLILNEELWPIELDKSQFETSLLNLALNARDAMPAGGVLSIETGNLWANEWSVPAREGVVPGPYVMLAVKDTGIGMTRAVIDQAIQPFFTTKASGYGSGLGLSMVYGFVRQSGGYLRINSAPGEGTRVETH